MRNIGLLLLFIITTVSFSFAQQNNTGFSIAVFSENFGLNALPQGSPLHLGGAIELEFTKKQNGIYRSTNNIELGYFNHSPIFQAAYLAWKPKYQWEFNNGFQLHSLIGLGYLHALPTQTTYSLEAGQYQATTNHGQPGGMAAMGLGLGYQFAKDSKAPVTLFFRQELIVIAPFNLYKDLPLGVNSMLKMGITFHPF